MNLPSLGPRGEGWLVGQLLLLAAVGIAPVTPLADPGASTARLVGALAVVVGLLVAGRGVLDLGSSLSPFPRPTPHAVLVEHGVYRRVRHPIYAGLVLLALGWSLARGSAVGLGLTLVLAVYLDLKARREEAMLAAAFPGYGTYRDRTKRFIPGVY